MTNRLTAKETVSRTIATVQTGINNRLPLKMNRRQTKRQEFELLPFAPILI